MPKAPHKIARLATEYRAAAPARPAETEEESAELTESVRWAGVICMEGTPTGDGRLIEHGALKWNVSPSDPIPFRHVVEDVGGHDGAQVSGRIENIVRLSGGRIWADGDFDIDSEVGVESRRQVKEKLARGVSVDLDDVAFELRIASEVYDEAMLPEDPDAEPSEPERDAEGRVTVVAVNPSDEVMVTTSARVRAATQVATPAFAEAYIDLVDEDYETPTGVDDSGDSDDDEDDEEEERTSEPVTENSLIAAAAPVHPPKAWFANPKLTEPTPVTVDSKGRIYGHVATWDVCHIANPYGTNECVSAPHSDTDYAYFHTGSVETKEGDTLGVGRITMDTKHAEANARHAAASDHYDHTGTAAADVRAGEDDFGIWISGAIRPGVSAAQVRTLRASPLSGDWRMIGGNLEMVAALAVNVPGFPIPRPKGLVASGAVTSIQAAGMVAPAGIEEAVPGSTQVLSDRDITYLKRLAQKGREAEAAEMAAKVRKSQAAMNRRKVESLRGKITKKET